MSHAFDTPKESQQNINFKKGWLAAHQMVVSNQGLDQAIQSIKTLESNSIFSTEMILIFSVQEFKPLYISSNVEKILGYSQKEFLADEGAFFRKGRINQPHYHENLLKWEKHFMDNSPLRKAQTKGRGHFCGVRYQHKDGSTRRFLKRQEIVFGENLIFPEFAIIYFEDITHLIKGDDYWFMFETTDGVERFSKFYRKEGIDNYPITTREKEILSLVAAGKSTKEVANLLHISPDTVAQHRKNMIKKMMAKDTSALIQLCKMCEII